MTEYCKWCGKELKRGQTERKDNFETRVVYQKGTACYRKNRGKDFKGTRIAHERYQTQEEMGMATVRMLAESARNDALRRGLGFDKGRILPRDEINRLIVGGKITPICCISSNHLLPYGSDVGGGYGT